HGTVGLDEEEAQEVEATTVVVALGPYTGGGMQIAPGARMDDGLFDVVTIGALPARELLRNLPRIYSGTHLSHPAVRHGQAQLVRCQSILMCSSRSGHVTIRPSTVSPTTSRSR